MPYSYFNYKKETADLIREIANLGVNKILDVGPGSGTYANLLPKVPMDAVEIYAPYVEKFELTKKYTNVFVCDIMDFDFSEYHLLILGDVLEHLSVENAQKLLEKIENNRPKLVAKQLCVVAIPYRFIQGEYEGNSHETHIQDDLTPEIVKSRYPMLKFLWGDENYGYFCNFAAKDIIGIH